MDWVNTRYVSATHRPDCFTDGTESRFRDYLPWIHCAPPDAYWVNNTSLTHCDQMVKCELAFLTTHFDVDNIRWWLVEMELILVPHRTRTFMQLVDWLSCQPEIYNRNHSHHLLLPTRPSPKTLR